MALAPEDRAFLKRIFQRLDPNQPLQPGDPFYQPVYEAPGCEDPVEQLERCIEFSVVESLQMFSGFRGSGKTTELLRLKKRLTEQGYLVLYANALDYISPAEPIDITDLLIVLAGSFNDALKDTLDLDLAHESYWTRFTHYLTKTNIELEQFNIKPEISTPLKVGADIKLALQTTPSFRQRLREALSNRVGELQELVHRFVQDGVQAIRRHQGPETGVVFLFDSLEQLRGSYSTEQAVLQSVEQVFAQHLRLLRLPSVHTVYTVPPWLQFVLPGSDMTVLWTIKLWDNDAARSECTPGMQALRGLVLKRLGEEGVQRYFGDDPASAELRQADRLIRASGGHFRDLLLLMRETILRARTLPITPSVVEAAIQSVRSNYLPIAVEDARWLDRIERTRTAVLQTSRPEEVSRFTKFLDTHFVLYLRNGVEWYDIHPLIREEVREIVARNPEAPPA